MVVGQGRVSSSRSKAARLLTGAVVTRHQGVEILLGLGPGDFISSCKVESCGLLQRALQTDHLHES
eukprot:4775346-Alexandrium_andersonii.AAC.1